MNRKKMTQVGDRKERYDLRTVKKLQFPRNLNAFALVHEETFETVYVFVALILFMQFIMIQAFLRFKVMSVET